jgi:hypothetical protein
MLILIDLNVRGCARSRTSNLKLGSHLRVFLKTEETKKTCVQTAGRVLHFSQQSDQHFKLKDRVLTVRAIKAFKRDYKYSYTFLKTSALDTMLNFTPWPPYPPGKEAETYRIGG